MGNIGHGLCKGGFLRFERCRHARKLRRHLGDFVTQDLDVALSALRGRKSAPLMQDKIDLFRQIGDLFVTPHREKDVEKHRRQPESDHDDDRDGIASKACARDRKRDQGRKQRDGLQAYGAIAKNEARDGSRHIRHRPCSRARAPS